METINPNELSHIRELKLRAELASTAAQLAASQYQAASQLVFLRHKMSEADSFDLQTGMITRAPAASEALPANDAPPPQA